MSTTKWLYFCNLAHLKHALNIASLAKSAKQGCLCNKNANRPNWITVEQNHYILSVNNLETARNRIEPFDIYAHIKK